MFGKRPWIELGDILAGRVSREPGAQAPGRRFTGALGGLSQVILGEMARKEQERKTWADFEKALFAKALQSQLEQAGRLRVEQARAARPKETSESYRKMVEQKYADLLLGEWYNPNTGAKIAIPTKQYAEWHIGGLKPEDKEKFEELLNIYPSEEIFRSNKAMDEYIKKLGIEKRIFMGPKGEIGKWMEKYRPSYLLKLKKAFEKYKTEKEVAKAVKTGEIDYDLGAYILRKKFGAE